MKDGKMLHGAEGVVRGAVYSRVWCLTSGAVGFYLLVLTKNGGVRWNQEGKQTSVWLKLSKSCRCDTNIGRE